MVNISYWVLSTYRVVLRRHVFCLRQEAGFGSSQLTVSEEEEEKEEVEEEGILLFVGILLTQDTVHCGDTPGVRGPRFGQVSAFTGL